MCTKVKACNQIQFFKPEYKRVCDKLDNFRLNYQFKVFTISNIKRINKKSFYCSYTLSLNLGSKNNIHPLDLIEWNGFEFT